LKKAGQNDLYMVPISMGQTNAITPLHCEQFSLLLAQIVGTSYIRVYKKTLADHLYLHQDYFLKYTSQVELRFQLWFF
jgi:lysine-specific demethylase 8